MPPDLRELAAWVKSAAAALGFDLAGIAGVGERPELDWFGEWIAAGHAGEMRYLEARNESGELKRASLANAAPWARSAIVCAANYHAAAPLSTGPAPSGAGWISRYAWGAADYHDFLLPRLRRLEAHLREEVTRRSPGTELRTWAYVDTGPVVERVLAKYAGLGWIGKNACLIHQQKGSWLFLGVILTSLGLPADLPPPDRCGSCTRCLDACPTKAFLGPGKLDATRCISYLTIEKRGPIPEELRPGVGRHVFGCDICQDVCPWNRRAAPSDEAAFQPRPGLVNPALDELASLDLDGFRRLFRGSPVKRTRFSGLRRNLAVAMGNSGDPRFRLHLERLAADADPVVAEHARWALARLEDRRDERSRGEAAGGRR
jgi:epoxyqueuosine reductase